MHENYLVDRAVPFNDLAARLIPFFVTRQVFTGAGRVGIGQRGERPGFQLSQRADYMEAEIGLETTLRRPIINTRDEPHADPDRWRRLHVIIGDATMLEVSTYLRLGTTSLVLWLIERAVAEGGAGGALAVVDRLTLRDPVQAVHLISHDLTLTARVELADGRHLTALEIQQEYLDRRADRPGARTATTSTSRARTCWTVGRRCSTASRPTRPAARARSSGWPSSGCSRACGAATTLRGTTRDSPRWTCSGRTCGPSAGLYHRLVSAGAVELLVTPEQVGEAVLHPPRDTRAYFRGEAVARYGAEISAASWDSVVFDVPGAATLQRVPMRDPLRGTAAHVGDLLDRSPDAATLLAALGA